MRNLGLVFGLACVIATYAHSTQGYQLTQGYRDNAQAYAINQDIQHQAAIRLSIIEVLRAIWTDLIQAVGVFSSIVCLWSVLKRKRGVDSDKDTLQEIIVTDIASDVGDVATRALSDPATVCWSNKQIVAIFSRWLNSVDMCQFVPPRTQHQMERAE